MATISSYNLLWLPIYDIFSEFPVTEAENKVGTNNLFKSPNQKQSLNYKYSCHFQPIYNTE